MTNPNLKSDNDPETLKSDTIDSQLTIEEANVENNNNSHIDNVKDEDMEKDRANIKHEEQNNASQQQSTQPIIQNEKSNESPKNDTISTATTQVQQLSKNQIRKKRRIELQQQKHTQRKQQRKVARYAKALAEGRDIEEENREQERRTQLGEGNKRRALLEKQRFDKAETSFGVCMDCSYEGQMTDKEISSLALQIRYCYASNKRAQNPCRFYASSLSGKTFDNLSKVNGFPQQWLERAFTPTEQHFTQYWKDEGLSNKLVYLTSDSENVIQTLDNDKIYIIGGIVDRNRLKEAAFTQAELHSIPTAKLPITDYVKTLATKVLTCNHVFEILLKYREYGNNWEKALIDVLPQRKGLSAVKDDDEESETQEEIKDGESKESENREVDDLKVENELAACDSK